MAAVKKLYTDKIALLRNKKSEESCKDKICMIYRTMQAFERVPDIEACPAFKEFDAEFKKEPLVSKIIQDK